MAGLVVVSHDTTLLHIYTTIYNKQYRMATGNKYDRQLRLWGATGQKALSESHVLLVNADAAGTETLKNLVLPGLGYFTILDNSKLTPNDAGSNFFAPSGFSQYRAEVVLSIFINCFDARSQTAKELLCEMNPDDVVGNFVISTLRIEIQKGKITVFI